MSQILVRTAKMPREEWLEYRRKGIGGSDAGAVLGVHPFTSKLALYQQKIGEYIPEKESDAMYWGKVLEPGIAQKFAEETGFIVRRCNAILKHNDHPFMIADLDRIIIDKNTREKGILECKTGHEYTLKNWTGNSVPWYYMAQVQHYLAVTGYSFAYIAVLIGGQKFFYDRIEPDREFIDGLIDAEREFWKLIESRTPPLPDGSESSTVALKALFPRAKSGTVVKLPAEALETIINYENAMVDEKNAQRAKDDAANKLKMFLGESERGEIEGWSVNWTNYDQNKFDMDRFKKEHPDLYKEYCKPQSNRRFTIKN